jgi:hypothetical protein
LEVFNLLITSRNKTVNQDHTIAFVSYRQIRKFAEGLLDLLGLLAAIAFLIVPVWVIWAVEEYKGKLIAVTVSVIIFALWVRILTSATRAELFVVVAGYAAVLVVYVGKG